MQNADPRRGEIWFAYMPGRARDPHQPRPAVIMSVNDRNRSTDTVLIVPAYSTGRLGPTRVRLPAGTGGIAHDSVLFCGEVTTIEKDLLADGPLGPIVAPQLLEAVVRAVRRALGDIVLEPSDADPA